MGCGPVLLVGGGWGVGVVGEEMLQIAHEPEYLSTFVSGKRDGARIREREREGERERRRERECETERKK